MRTALIDADILVYQAAAVSEKVIDWGDGLWTIHAYEEDGIRSIAAQVDRILEATEADDFLMCLSTESNEGFRVQVLPTYKGNRSKTRPPMLRAFLKQYVLDNYKTYLKPTLEGDDILGILMTHPTLIKGEKVCCTLDKDLKTIPGQHYDFGKRLHFTVTPEEAHFYHMQQALSGDTTDGYSGCPSIGTETAIEYLSSGLKEVPYEHVLKSGANKGTSVQRWRKEPAENLWEIVVSLYEKAGLCEEEALVQAQVARICQHQDYDFKKKEVVLWTPKTQTQRTR